MVSKRIILWSAPRCLSTAFERSMSTLSNIKVLSEPYSMAFLLGPERQSVRCIAEPIDHKSSYDKISETLLQDHEGVDVLFVKEMAYHVENRFEMFAEERFKQVKHTFIIRDPTKSIPSLYRLSTSPELTGWDYFISNESGVRQLYELYEFIRKRVDPNPIVVDADDLQDNPDEIMKTYCNAVGIKYEPHMTSWEQGPAPQWEIWPKGWYKSLIESTGFLPRDKKWVSSEALKDQPEEVMKAIEDAKPYYELLAAKRIREK